jgi:hypothetical protein
MEAGYIVNTSSMSYYFRTLCWPPALDVTSLDFVGKEK